VKPIHILLAEDSEGDILLTTEALQEGRILNTLSVVTDGHEAICFLEKSGKYADVERPDLILLDVNMPKKNGHEVLHFIKHDDRFKTIPVIMLTTSSSEKDVYQSYFNYVNCYIVKPMEVDKFLKVISTIEDFWLQITRLPSSSMNPWSV
jgi:CheY-like chemotaxis protein